MCQTPERDASQLVAQEPCVVLQQDTEGSLRGLVRQLSIDQFENEGRRVDPESSAKHQNLPILERTSMDPGSVHKVEASSS